MLSSNHFSQTLLGQFLCQRCERALDQEQCHSIRLNPLAEESLVDYIAAQQHQGLSRVLLHNFKYRRQLTQGKILTHRLIRGIQVHYAFRAMPTAIIPIPSSAMRLKQRGFSQTRFAATWLAQVLGLQTYHPLVKEDHIPRQTGLTGSRRLKNMRNGFYIKPCLAKVLQNINHIALVDDTLTTGATVQAAYNSIKTQSPLIKVDVWALTHSSSTLN